MYSNYRPLTVLSPSIVQLVTPTPTTTSTKSTKTSTSFRTTTLPTELLLPSTVPKTTKSSTTFESSESFTSSYTSSEPSSTSNFLDFKKSSNNLALGLGLGIPIGLFFITLITLGSWYYFKQKKKTNKPILPSHKEFNTSFKNPYIGPFSEETGTKQETSEIRYEKEYAERGYGKDYQKDYSKDFDKYDASFNEKITTPVRFMSVPQKIKRESVALYHRFSKIGKIEEESNSISPMFLKRFNLNKPFTPKTPKNQKVNIQGDGRVAGVYSNNSNAVSSKYSNLSQEPKPNKDKLLPKLPSLIKMENPVEDSKFKVIRTFKKNLSDEIDLKIGETVEILKIHRDDWCLIKNEFGGIGMAPKNCLEIVR